MLICIGITGPSAAGKDTVADILTELAEAHGLRMYRYSLSDVVRDELARRNRQRESASRMTLIELANELRITHGGGILASRIVTEVQRSVTSGGSEPSLVLAVGIRSPDEVKTFRDKWAGRFILLAVQASTKARATRTWSRGQYRDDVDPSGEVEQADLAIGISACVGMSDWRILNDGTIEELKTRVQSFFECSIIPLLRHAMS